MACFLELIGKSFQFRVLRLRNLALRNVAEKTLLFLVLVKGKMKRSALS